MLLQTTTMFTEWLMAGLTILLTKGFTGLADTLLRDLQTAWVFTDLLDVIFTTLQVREGSGESKATLADFLTKEFESSRVTLLIDLRGKLGLTCLLGTLLTGLQVNLNFPSLLGALETGLQATLDFRDLLGTSKIVSQRTLYLTGLLGPLQTSLHATLDFTDLLEILKTGSHATLNSTG